MSKPVMKGYPAAFKERAVKLAVESEQSIAQTARDLGVNENTLGDFRKRPYPVRVGMRR
jgi:transposase